MIQSHRPRKRILTGIHKAPRRRLAVGGVIASITMLMSVFVSPSPAQAYDNNDLKVFSDVVLTTNCSDGGGGYDGWYWQDGYCWNDDGLDGTWFVPQPDGKGMKITIYDRPDFSVRGLLGKVEWHPHGEHLWVYDTRNDSDTFYVELIIRDPRRPSPPYYVGAFGAPGTSAKIDIGHHNLDLPEGFSVSIGVYDDSNHTDRIGGACCGTT
jgi:hypothetical protein